METSTAAPNLPSSASFVDTLIDEIAHIKSSPGANVNDQEPPRPSTAPPEQRAQNVLAGLSTWETAKIKPMILTLHCLFPNDLLPALDILDRRLVHHLLNEDTVHAAAAPTDIAMAAEQSKEPETSAADHYLTRREQDVFLVTSASALPPHPPGTSPTHDQDRSYEVRLRAWNCSCPTFAFSAFRDLTSRLDVSPESSALDTSVVYSFPFGGTLPCATDRIAPPVCKHILACVLFARCPGLFGHEDGTRRVSREELAGWCAGWGG
ncbi:hypothetical protein N7492_009305 [Penicillium capsulatum]|uniref:SWIM-type domain-containing protein n=1 Tax=Penicillium capsulatum TaxID=69766 RepID=A0A9W9HTS9_9EURO|nr:hypothetical protein N7492_009305 [Penicillium capsulatum]KAJ6106699.1 hypothetical protein N7512_010216 [Penicillium capsulatum]